MPFIICDVTLLQFQASWSHIWVVGHSGQCGGDTGSPQFFRRIHLLECFQLTTVRNGGTCQSWCLIGGCALCFPVSSVSHRVSDLHSQASALPRRHWWAWHLHKYQQCTCGNGISESEDRCISSAWCSLCLALVHTWYCRKCCVTSCSWSYICKVCHQHSFPFCSSHGHQRRTRPRQRRKEWPGGDGCVLSLVGTGGTPTGSSREEI